MEHEAAISITHFINPHHFWYTEVEDTSRYLSQRNRLESYLAYINQTKCLKSFEQRYVWQEGDKVAVKFVLWNKIIRGEYIRKFDYLGKQEEHLIWAIDYGFPFTTSAKFIWRLPIELAEELENVLWGGISNIYPGELKFDFNVKKHEVLKSEKWCKKSCDLLEEAITDSASISFIQNVKTKDNHQWGDLKIWNHHGEEFLASEILLNANNAVVAGTKFYDDMLKKKVHPRTLLFDSNLNNNYRKNEVNAEIFVDERVHSSLHACDSHTRNKIDIWDEQNKRDINNKTPKQPIDFNYMTEDVEFDDSASQFSNKNAAQTKLIAQKMPRMPDSSDFEINITDNTEIKIIGDTNVLSENALLALNRHLPFDYFKNKCSVPLSTTNCSLNAKFLRENKLRQLRRIRKSAQKDENSSLLSNKVSNSKLEHNNNNKSLDTTAFSTPEKTNRHRGFRPNLEDNSDSFLLFSASKNNKAESTKKITIIPAGFDESNLNYYKDENHWHRKKTTLYDRIPHTEEKLSQASSVTTKNENVKNLSTHSENYKTNDKKIACAMKSPDNLLTNKGEKLKSDDELLVEIKSYQQPFKNNNFAKQLKLTNNNENAVLSKDTTEIHCPIEDNFEIYKSETNIKQTTNLVNKQNLINSSEDVNSIQQATKDNKILSKKPLFDSSNDNTVEQTKEEMPIHHSIVKNDEIVDVANISQTTNAVNTKNLIELQLATSFVENIDEPVLYNKTEYWILAHSKVELHPINRVADTIFLTEIHEAMMAMKITKRYRVQAYSWSHLKRNNSLFVVNPARSGKTWSYLPAICSMVAYRMYCSDNSIPRTYGPIAIILVNSSSNVEKVDLYCRLLLRKWEKNEVKPCVPSFGIRNSVFAKLQLLNSCGILVTTPASMLRILKGNQKESLINPQRLRHLVVDDIDLMYSCSRKDVDNAIKSIIKMCDKQNNTTSTLQLVFTSREWHTDFIPYIQTSSEPLLLIGNFLEASVYGKASISINLVAKTKKMDALLVFLEKIPVLTNNRHTIIICNCDDDVQSVEETLICSGYECLTYLSCAENEMRFRIDAWKKQRDSTKILICTDDTFPDLEIQNAKYLIHFSMPSSWSKFTRRFYALTDTYTNLIDLNFQTESESSSRAVSLVLLDEGNSLQLPKLVEFMQKHNQEVHQHILAMSKRILTEREEQKKDKNSMLCSCFLEFGECLNLNCAERHSLTSDDRVTKENGIPKNGDLRILVLKVISPTHCIARLLQHKPLNSNKWHDILRSSEYTKFFASLNLFYADINNLKRHWPPKVGDMCIYKMPESPVQRVRILKLNKTTTNYNFIQPKIPVVIQLIDVGTVIWDVKADDLLECANEFKDFPPQAMNIRLMNIVPHDNERTWDSNATNMVKKWIVTDVNKEKYTIHVTISLAMKHTIWVNNIKVMQRFPTLDQSVFKINLKRLLIDNDYGVLSRKESGIYQIAKEQHFLESENNENDNHNENYSSEKSVNLNTSSATEEKISTDDRQLHGQKLKNYQDLLMCENSEKHKILTNIENDCLADEKIDEHLSKSSASEVRNVLLSNNIHTSIEKWCDVPLRQFTNVELSDEQENDKWTNIYVQRTDSESQTNFLNLTAIIDDHVTKLQKLNKSPLDVSTLAAMFNCVVKYDEKYMRAKLVGIFGYNAGNRIYRFFLCDYACFINVPDNDISNDFLYESTKEIIEYMPYQAVHCTLVGVRLDLYAKQKYRVELPYQFIYPIARNECASTVKGLLINSFSVVMYESKQSTHLNGALMLNKKLIELGIAQADPETEQFLEVNVPTELEQSKVEKSDRTDDENAAAITDEKTLTFEELMHRVLAGAFDDADSNQESNKIVSKNLQTKQNNGASVNLKTNNKTNEHVDIADNRSTTLNDVQIPALYPKTKIPRTIWYESKILIYLVIYAPDISDYYLKITADAVVYSAIVQGNQETLVLNLLGKVDPAHVSHELRGLNVLVRMAKTVHMIWPRLVKQTDKLPWLKYDINTIETKDLSRKILKRNVLSDQLALAEQNSNGSCDSDDEITQTYIEKGGDNEDPILS